MTTYGTMQARIADETSTSLSDAIKNGIQDAIKHYGTHRFAFNQGQLTFTTVAGQYEYGAAANADIPNIVKIDATKVGQSDWDERVDPARYEEIFTDFDVSSGGNPELIAYRDGKIYVSPTPGAGYTVTVAYVKKLAALTLDADTNAWMTTGERLIRCRAKFELYEHVVSQYDDAERMRRAEKDEYRNLMQARKQLVDRAPARMTEVAAAARGSGRYNIYGDTF